MSTQLATTEPRLTVADELQKAWHLFSILFSLGRPAPPLELASLCTLFPASLDLVQYLCRIPYSPIFLTNDLAVTYSSASLTASVQFHPNFSFVSAPQPQRICKTYARKRKRSVCQLEFSLLPKRRLDLDLEDAQGNGSFLRLLERVQGASHKVYFSFKEDRIWSSDTWESYYPDKGNELVLMPPLLANGTRELRSEDEEHQNRIIMTMARSVLLENVYESKCQHSSCKIEEIPGTLSPVKSERIVESQGDPAPNISFATMEESVSCEEANAIAEDSFEKENINEASCSLMNQKTALCNEMSHLSAGENRTIAERRVELFKGYVRSTGEAKDPFSTFNASRQDRPSKTESNKKNQRKHLTVHRPTKSHAALPAFECSPPPHKPLSAATSKQLKAMPRDKVSSRMRVVYESLEHRKDVVVCNEKEKLKRSQKLDNTDQKLKHSTAQGQEKTGNATSAAPEGQAETTPFPDFESYVIEEEEGSGGYGTVYRARRKDDGTTVAIKCPHANARRHHVVNELRMLERFGGKNFIINYQGCFKSGDSDCFVLEHVHHDRPEVLKKEIDVLQLQWYGYCLLRALSSLHKQGIIHRDVKPGNFLFSRKANKGYLIDFNLAMDLNQKFEAKNKPKMGTDTTPDNYFVAKPPPATKSGKTLSIATAKKEEAKPSRANSEHKRKLTDQTNPRNDLGGWNAMRSQGADGSGITSTRETKTTSADRFREPEPRPLRKEFKSFLQKTMYANQEVVSSSVPSPMRKRVAAPPGKGHTIITPMPLYKIGGSVSGAGLRTNKGDNKKDGPCVGTKGFRAPEVLLRSAHQGPKLDVWSAGVTLLYLSTGKMPFFGDPEQNIKDIAKMKGSEELWEVAKLHNRESSLPTELYDTRYLPSMKVLDWCTKMTRRQDLLEVIPSSFFDLLEKCLAVNPRQRISADEALRHEFFTPCHDALWKKQKLQRREYSSHHRVAAADIINVSSKQCQ